MAHEQGTLKNLLKRTYLKHWVGKGSSEHENEFHQGTTESSSVNRKISMDLARFIQILFLFYVQLSDLIVTLMFVMLHKMSA